MNCGCVIAAMLLALFDALMELLFFESTSSAERRRTGFASRITMTIVCVLFFLLLVPVSELDCR